MYDHFEEKTIEKSVKYQGKIFTVEQHQVLLPNEKTAVRDVIRHNGAIAVLTHHEGKMLFVRQYRKAIEQHLLEIPAGKLDTLTELPLDAAKRELEEETQLVAKKWTALYAGYASPGYCDEKIYLFKAEQLSEKRDDVRPRDEDEFLNIIWLTPEQIDEAIANGDIQDLKTFLAIQIWYNELQREERK